MLYFLVRFNEQVVDLICDLLQRCISGETKRLKHLLIKTTSRASNASWIVHPWYLIIWFHSERDQEECNEVSLNWSAVSWRGEGKTSIVGELDFTSTNRPGKHVIIDWKVIPAILPEVREANQYKDQWKVFQGRNSMPRAHDDESLSATPWNRRKVRWKHSSKDGKVEKKGEKKLTMKIVWGSAKCWKQNEKFTMDGRWRECLIILKWSNVSPVACVNESLSMKQERETSGYDHNQLVGLIVSK